MHVSSHTYVLNIMIQQNQSDTMLKQVLKLSENQEVDQIADVVQVELHFKIEFLISF